jgi:hypothetical protein
VLQYIKGEFLRHRGSVPHLVRLLAIDTDIQADTTGIDRPIAALSQSEFYHVIVRNVRDFITTPELQEWLPPEEKLNLRDIARGAGQRRVSGRIAFFSKADEISRKVNRAIVELLAVGRNQDDEGTGSGAPSGPDEAEIEVYVVCSVAGGTGSGMFLDMGYLLRKELGLERNRIVGIFVLPKVFTRATDASENVEGNGYAALKELDYWMGCRDESTVNYPYGLKVQWGGSQMGRKPYNLVYLLDDINDRDLRVRDLETLQNVCANALFLHMTIESQSVESFWKNLEDQLDEHDIDWEGKRPHYMSMGMSTLEVPIGRSVELAVVDKAAELLQSLAPIDGQVPSNVAGKPTQSTVTEVIISQKLGVDDLLASLTPKTEFPIRSHGFENAAYENPQRFRDWLASAKAKLQEDVTSQLNAGSKDFGQFLSTTKDSVRKEVERIVLRDSSKQGGRFVTALMQVMDANMTQLRARAREPLPDEPDCDAAFKRTFGIGRRVHQLEGECQKHLEAARRVFVEAAKRDLGATTYAALQSVLRDLSEDVLPSFDRVTQVSGAILQRERSKIQRSATREPFTEDLGTQLLKIDLEASINKTTIQYIAEEWSKRSDQIEGAGKTETSPPLDLRSLLTWSRMDPEELVAWLLPAVRRQFERILGESVDDRLGELWDKPETRDQLKAKIEGFVAKASPLWRVTPARNMRIKQHLLFGIAERKDGSHGILRRILEDKDAITLQGADGLEMPPPSFSTTWEKYRFRALRIAVPAAAYALKHMAEYRERYYLKESIENSRYTHHLARQWMGVKGLPDLFPPERGCESPESKG